MDTFCKILSSGLVFVITKVRVVEVPRGMEVAPKVFVIPMLACA
jgi:hypothetical protein